VIITVESGKGGTDKTTVAVNLALSIATDHRMSAYDSNKPLASRNPLLLDCDVEEPNAALFLRPAIQEHRQVGQMTPEVDIEACIHCGRCVEVGQYHAAAVVGKTVLVFPGLCHGCVVVSSTGPQERSTRCCA
jgi:MinD superfamily P-loop ATPase